MSLANSPTESIREDLASPALLKELYETCNARLKPDVEISLSDKSTIDGKIVIRCNDKFLLLVQRFSSGSNSGVFLSGGTVYSREESTNYTIKWFIEEDGNVIDGTVAWVTRTERRENVMGYSSKEPPRIELVQGILDQIQKMPVRTEKRAPDGIFEKIKEFVLRLVKTACPGDTPVLHL